MFLVGLYNNKKEVKPSNITFRLPWSFCRVIVQTENIFFLYLKLCILSFEYVNLFRKASAAFLFNSVRSPAAFGLHLLCILL